MKPYEIENAVRERLTEIYGTRFCRAKLIIDRELKQVVPLQVIRNSDNIERTRIQD